uniref:Bacterial surface antigen (D15) domain-containing protein n=1 Tax=Clastoptera arizonana TaxID=38151 RepID=A0A1B6D716_9HEMI
MGTVHAKNIQSNYSEEDQRTLYLKGIKARVDRVHVDGLIRTKNDIVQECIKDVFTATNFDEVIRKSDNVRMKLDSLGCFQNIRIHIDTNKASETGYEVTFLVQELNRIKGSVNTMVGGNNEGSVVIGLKTPNLFGRGESIHGEYSYGSKKTQMFNVTYVKPLIPKLNATISTSVFQNEQEWSVSGYKLTNKGLLADLMFFSLQNLKHNLQWEGTLRDLTVGHRFASFEVREDAGSTLKSSLRHILTFDTRDTKIFPNSGYLAQLTTEFAGLGGNVGFLKNEGLIQSNIPLFSDIVLQGTLSGGVLTPSSSSDKKVIVCDNFFLGGPLSVRGFQVRGIGPVSDGSFVGAKTYWSGALHLFTPLPFRPGAGGLGELFRTHFFANAGNIVNLEKVSNTQDLFKRMTEETRLVYGVGLAIRFGQVARLELNYCFPVVFKDTDSVVKGVQFGAGIHFL